MVSICGNKMLFFPCRILAERWHAMESWFVRARFIFAREPGQDQSPTRGDKPLFYVKDFRIKRLGVVGAGFIFAHRQRVWFPELGAGLIPWQDKSPHSV